MRNNEHFYENIVMTHLINKKFTLLPLIIVKSRESQRSVTNSVNRAFSQYLQLFGYFCRFYDPGIIFFLQMVSLELHSIGKCKLLMLLIFLE